MSRGYKPPCTLTTEVTPVVMGVAGGRIGGNGGNMGVGGACGGNGGGVGPDQKLILLVKPLAMLKLWSVQPAADHSAPFQPSPYESDIMSVHKPGCIACVAL